MLHRLRDAFERRLFPPLSSYVYRFTIFLPILSEGREVFSGLQRQLLKELFHACFGGYTEAAAEGHPPVYGSWLPPGATQPIVDRHILMAVYTPQIEVAKDFFRQLRWILEQKHVADQEVVLIEHTSVWLVEPSPLSSL